MLSLSICMLFKAFWQDKAGGKTPFKCASGVYPDVYFSVCPSPETGHLCGVPEEGIDQHGLPLADCALSHVHMARHSGILSLAGTVSQTSGILQWFVHFNNFCMWKPTVSRGPYKCKGPNRQLVFPLQLSEAANTLSFGKRQSLNLA